MDNINQTAQTQPPINTEFAEKGPLLTPKLKKRIIMGCGGAVLLLGLLVGGLLAYQQLTKPPELVAEPPKPPITTPDPVISDTPRFAYIKNDKNIWISNIDGGEKFSILELPLTSQSTIISLSWKNKENLSYSTCDPSTQVCEISTYNFETKAIKPEITTTGSSITKFSWSKDARYLAYIENRAGKTNLRLKLGTIDSIFKTIEVGQDDPLLSKTFVGFNSEDQYVMYSTPHTIVTSNARGQETSRTNSQNLYVFQTNGAQIDEVENITYPFFIDNDTIAYKFSNRLIYKDIGTTDESAITDFAGYNPAMSPNENQIAYWRDEVGFNNVVLGVFESDRSIHRNILRGVILPVWISPDKLVGIKADSCIGERCLLYEFQTTSMVIVDVNNGEVISVDQGKSLSGVSFYAD